MILSNYTIEQQEEKVKFFLHQTINNPDIQSEYLKELNILEILILQEAEKYHPKTPEYFNIRREAFATRPKFAKHMLSLWVAKFGSSLGCPHKYEDTLNIPFKSIATQK